MGKSQDMIELFRADKINLNAKGPWAASLEEAIGFSCSMHDYIHKLAISEEIFQRDFTASGYGYIHSGIPHGAVCLGKAEEIDLGLCT